MVQQQPGTRGIFRRLSRGKGSAARAFLVVEELYGPSRHDARVQIEEQQRLVRPAPSPSDPPDDPGADDPR